MIIWHEHCHCLDPTSAKMLLYALQVQEKAENVAAPLLAALQQKEAAKEAVRQKYVASGPARQSKRAGAERTRAKLQQQAEESAGSSDDEESVLSDAEDSDSDSPFAARSKAAQASQKRKRTAQEVEFDPAGDMVMVKTEQPQHARRGLILIDAVPKLQIWYSKHLVEVMVTPQIILKVSISIWLELMTPYTSPAKYHIHALHTYNMLDCMVGQGIGCECRHTLQVQKAMTMTGRNCNCSRLWHCLWRVVLVSCSCDFTVLLSLSRALLMSGIFRPGCMADLS